MKKLTIDNLYTVQKRSTLEYELANRKSMKEDFVDYEAFLEYQKAIKKLGMIEDFERVVKMPVLDYLSNIHEKYQELRKRNAILETIKINDFEYCPVCMTKVLLFQNYCSQCGQAIFYGKEV